MLKTWDLAKKLHFASFLSKKAEYANFIDSGLILMQNDTHEPILIFEVSKLFHFSHTYTVNLKYDFAFFFFQRFALAYSTATTDSQES